MKFFFSIFYLRVQKHYPADLGCNLTRIPKRKENVEKKSGIKGIHHGLYFRLND